MPNRGQTQDPGNRGRKPGTFSPDDDETAQNEDNQRQAQEPQDRRRQENPGSAPTEMENDEAGQDDGDETSVSQ